MHKFPLLFLFLLSLGFALQAQHPVFRIEGTVHGYANNPGQGLLKENKVTLLEGTLENALISITQNGKTIQQLHTNDKGFFELELSFDALYQLNIFKKGYNRNQLIIDTRAFTTEIKTGGFVFSGAEFVLNSYKNGNDSSLHRNLGRLYYNPASQHFNSSSNMQQQPTGLFVSTPVADTPADLLQRAIDKNNRQLLNYSPLAKKDEHGKKRIHSIGTEKTNVEPGTVAIPDPTQEALHPLAPKASPIDSGSSQIDWHQPLLSGIDEYIMKREEAISQEKAQLAIDRLRARSHEDSLQIVAREQEIRLAVADIHQARLLIHSQSQKLVTQRNSLFLAISLLVLSAGL